MTAFSDPHHNRAIILLAVAAFGSSAAARLCDPMLPELARTFAARPAAVAHVVSAFSVAYGLMQAFFGPLGDRVGKYRLVALTTLASVFGTVGAALASSLDWLVFFRLLAGATAAGIIPLSMAWIGDTVPYEHRQPTLARFMGGQIAGVIGGQFLGGLFTDTLGWRWAFAFLAVIYLAVGWMVLAESRANPRAQHQPQLGASPRGMLHQIAQLFRRRWARVILAVVFLEGMLVFGALALVPSYLHGRFGMTLTGAGALMASFGVGGLSYILVARHLVRRLGETGLALLGGALIALAWALLAYGPSWAWAIPASYCVGLGFYMLHNTLQTNATQMAPDIRGTAVSLFASSFFLGQSLGVVVAAIVFDRFGFAVLVLAAGLLLPVVSGVFARLLSRRHRQLHGVTRLGP